MPNKRKVELISSHLLDDRAYFISINRGFRLLRSAGFKPISVRNIQMLPCMQEMASPPVRKAGHPPLRQKPSCARQLPERESNVLKIFADKLMLEANPVAYGSPFSVGYNAQLCFRWRREMPTGRGMRISGNLKVSNTVWFKPCAMEKECFTKPCATAFWAII
jgi:hypothetical protein